MSTTRAGWAQFDSTPPLGLPMGGRGPRFSSANEVLELHRRLFWRIEKVIVQSGFRLI